jgi:hypothetical protein
MKMACIARSFILFGIVAVALSGAARAGGSDVLVLTEGQMETITAGSALSAGDATALAAGSRDVGHEFFLQRRRGCPGFCRSREFFRHRSGG